MSWGEGNPVYKAERQEGRDALASSGELERVAACRHDYRRGRCPYCGDTLDPLEC